MTDQTQPTTQPPAAARPLGMTMGDLQMQSAWQAWAEATNRANDATRIVIALQGILQPFAQAYAERLAQGQAMPDGLMIDVAHLARAYEALYGSEGDR